MTRFLRFLALALLAIGAIPAHAQRNEARDRAEIHELLMAYGATLDSRDFDGFGKLFGEGGVYVGGGGREAKGAAAGEMMRQVFANNPNGVGEPNFHLFYNEVVTFDGPDRARATSMSLWMVPDQATKRPTPLLAGRYEDELVRKNGKWLFARRVVKSVTNRPPEAK